MDRDGSQPRPASQYGLSLSLPLPLELEDEEELPLNEGSPSVVVRQVQLEDIADPQLRAQILNQRLDRYLFNIRMGKYK